MSAKVKLAAVNLADPAVKVSVIIKTLNEEARIGQAIRSALAAVERVGGEVILADSLSTDRTVAIAQSFPIPHRAIAKRRRTPLRRRTATGLPAGQRRFCLYPRRGDMELHPGFLEAALESMDSNPQLGGGVEEISQVSYQFCGRQRRKRESRAGYVRWLDMDGLYRQRAWRKPATSPIAICMPSRNRNSACA